MYGPLFKIEIFVIIFYRIEGDQFMAIPMDYNGGLTREQFLFHEARITAALLCQQLPRENILQKIREENLFQYPTERMVEGMVKVCFRRIDALNSPELTEALAFGTVATAKQVNLYAMMKYNRVMWDFMVMTIGEKFRTRDLDFSKKDLNLFFYHLQEQNDKVASWSDATVTKIKQVIQKSLVECEYLDSTSSERLNPVLIAAELENGIRENHDLAALPAFNCFY